MAARRGKKRALIAVGHTALIIAYTLLTRQQPYQDLGAVYFDQREQQRVERRLGAAIGAVRIRGLFAAEGLGQLTPLFSAEYPLVL